MTDLLKTHPHYLCVYGTLKPGHGNNYLIERHGGKDIGPCRTVGKYLLSNGFPYVWKLPRALTGAYHAYLGQVVGHLYKVSDEGLEACDRLEGHPRYYCRTNISVAYGPNGGAPYVTAGIYLMPGDAPSRDRLQTPVNGLLEWGREEPAVARNFQRRQANRQTGD